MLDRLLIYDIVELFPVGLVTGTTLRAADTGWLRLTALNPTEGAYDGPDGRGCRHRSPRFTAVRWSPLCPGCIPSSHPVSSHHLNELRPLSTYCIQKL